MHTLRRNGAGVGDDHDQPAAGHHRLDARLALGAEGAIPDREHLVEHQDLRIEGGGDREAEARAHPVRVEADRLVDERAEVGEVDDRLHALPDLPARDAEERGVQQDVLATRQLAIEAGAQREQRRDVAAHQNGSLVGLQDAREHQAERALARPVRTDHADHLALVAGEVDVAERPDQRRAARHAAAQHGLADRHPRALAESEVDPQPAQLDDRLTAHRNLITRRS